jgi:hypothetical protein
MIALALRNKAQILELYPAEWLVAYDLSYPGYVKYHATYAKTLEETASILK